VLWSPIVAGRRGKKGKPVRQKEKERFLDHPGKKWSMPLTERRRRGESADRLLRGKASRRKNVEGKKKKERRKAGTHCVRLTRKSSISTACWDVTGRGPRGKKMRLRLPLPKRGDRGTCLSGDGVTRYKREKGGDYPFLRKEKIRLAMSQFSERKGHAIIFCRRDEAASLCDREKNAGRRGKKGGFNHFLKKSPSAHRYTAIGEKKRTRSFKEPRFDLAGGVSWENQFKGGRGVSLLEGEKTSRELPLKEEERAHRQVVEGRAQS